jgi:hypothetical protein
MPSTYSSLKIQLMATGENNTSWGDVTNTNLGTAIEEAIVGSADVTFASGNVTLSLTDTNATQTARNMRLVCTGTTGGSVRNLVVPSIEKPYIVRNDCADNIVVKTAAGTGVTVPTSATMWVYSDGVNVVDVVTHLTLLTSYNVLATNVTASNVVTTNLTATNATATDLTATNFISTNVTVTGGAVTGINVTSSNLAASNAITDTGTIAAASPGLRGLPQNSQTGAYTLALTDAGKHISITTGGVVIPANGSVAFPIGSAIAIYNNSGSTQTISITTDTLRLAGTATTGSRTLAAYGLATCVKVASTTWVASGNVS